MKTMKFTDYITWLILCVGVCIGCSDKEEVVPSDLKDNYFAVPDDATDPESLLRKSFKQETGIHLLFNDITSLRTARNRPLRRKIISGGDGELFLLPDQCNQTVLSFYLYT